MNQDDAAIAAAMDAALSFMHDYVHDLVDAGVIPSGAFVAIRIVPWIDGEGVSLWTAVMSPN